MLTIEQIRAARALLDWSQSDLAEHADLSQTGIARIENGTNKPNSQTLTKIQAAFDKAGIEFMDTTGLRKRPEGRVSVYSGTEGFVQFLTNVYETLKEIPGERHVIVNNVSEDQFLRWEGDYVSTHQQRMEELKCHFRIIVQEGDTNFTADRYAEYRWIPQSAFSSVSYYIYADQAALISFEENNVTVYVIHSGAIANFYREEFEKIWVKAKIPN
jgi:predicted transcriptional regulator